MNNDFVKLAEIDSYTDGTKTLLRDDSESCNFVQLKAMSKVSEQWHFKVWHINTTTEVKVFKTNFSLVKVENVQSRGSDIF